MARKETPPPIDQLINGAWRDKAPCVGIPTEVFFPEEAPANLQEEYRAQALAICMPCPVRLECLEEELKWDTPWDVGGIRGGLKMSQRRRIRRERKDAKRNAEE